FTAALPPANTAGVLAALHILQREPERRDQLWANTRRLQEGLRCEGFDIGPTATPIVPVLIGPLEKTFLFWRKLFENGVFTNPVVPPAVPPTHCRLGTSLMATHTAQQIDHALEVFARLGKELGVIWAQWRSRPSSTGAISSASSPFPTTITAATPSGSHSCEWTCARCSRPPRTPSSSTRRRSISSDGRAVGRSDGLRPSRTTRTPARTTTGSGSMASSNV